MSSTAYERQDSLVKAAWVGSLPPNKKGPPPLKENNAPPEVFIIRGTFLANVLKTKFLNLSNIHKHLLKSMTTLNLRIISYIISYKFLTKNLLKD